MKKQKIIPVLISFLAMFLLVSSAHAGTFTVDPKYTTIHFRIKHIMGYAVGSFEKYEGTIKLNENNDALTGLEATIDAGSLNTKNEDRDEDLRSERFFDIEKFPQAKFVSKSITKDKIKGEFTLHGVTKTVELDYLFLGTALDQHGQTKAGLTIKGSLDRKDFGITFNEKTDDGGMLLGDDVGLMIEVEGILQK